jgi:hypothetical protein
MLGEPQPATLELPVGREEIEQLRFREAGMVSQHLHG